MAPRTTGTRFTDQARSLDLAVEAWLSPACISRRAAALWQKIFMGPDVQELLAPMRQFL